MRYSVIVLSCLLLISCGDQKSNPNKFSDKTFVKIGDYQDKRLSDSLYQYLSHENSSYRLEASLAFASIQDTSSISRLAENLTDESADVRGATAFALGQMNSSESAKYLMEALQSEKDNFVRDEILEAIGKTISSNQLKDFTILDFEISRGLSWCFYRLGLRGLTDSTMITKAVQMLEPNQNDRIRLGASHFFARARMNEIQEAEEALCNSALNDVSAYVRMASASALRKLKSEKSFTTIKKIILDDSDYRVKVNAVRALQAFSNNEVADLLFIAATDSNLHVGIAASETISAISNPDYYDRLIESARKIKYWRIKSNLYKAALKLNDNDALIEEIKKLYATEENAYAQAGLIDALGASTKSYKFISEKLLNAEVPVVLSTSASSLVSINRNKNFNNTLKNEFASIYKQALKINDLAVIGTIASALGDSTLGYKSVYKDYSFLYEARNMLSLPKDNEALQPLEAAIDYFEGKKTQTVVQNEFNHPIDWNLVKTIPKDQKVRIKTAKGEIIIQLLVEEAPGSVANFIELSRKDYFDSKNFHRVVPNFVIQGGCNRGDGWGGEDYSIRSEFYKRRYKEGSVGMASAGKDTEGTQWFITHSPTPHLDGRYSIFAEVVIGMDIVHEIQVGDLIQDIELIN